MEQKRTILVTGGLGYIGSHVAYLLAVHGYNVVVLDEPQETHIIPHPWMHYVAGDYANRQVLDSVFKNFSINAVIHCAGIGLTHDCLEAPLACYRDKVSKTVSLLEAMVEHNILSFIMSSGAEVYGDPQIFPLTEEHPLEPISPYGTSQAMIESVVRDIAGAYRLNFVILRMFYPVGMLSEAPFFKQDGGNQLLLSLVNAVRTGAPFYLFGDDYPTPDGTYVRDYVHVQDIAFAYYRSLLHLERKFPSDFFNIGSGKGWSIKELVAAAQRGAQREIEVIHEKRRPAEAAIVVAQPQKAMDILGWKPQYSSVEYWFGTLLKV